MMQCLMVAVSAASFCLTIVGLQDAGGKKQPTASVAGTAPALPSGFFLEKEPEGAKTVEESKAAAKSGDKVVIRGRIGGSKNPFIEKRAVFTLMGAGLKACSDDPEDKCKTPWDYCCDTAEAIAKHSATIQVVDAEGAPLRMGLKGTNGLKELSEVVIQGTVKEAKDKVMILNATAMYIVPEKSVPPKSDGK
ncbi:MAG: hypothetical protein A49_30590 [Methyloceanibacter sp.]|nr:MAG: hypothetical protein A49_30590 [Methyloceanibacter sp.]